MVKQLSDAFFALVQSLKNNLFHTFIAFCMVIVVMLVYQNFQAAQYVYMNTRQTTLSAEEQAIRFRNTIQSNEIINNSMEVLRRDTGADRVLLRQFHNGKHDLTSLPFTSLKTTFYVSKNQQGLTPQSFQSVPLSTLNNVIHDMWQDYMRPRCIIDQTSQIKDTAFKLYLEQNKVNYFVMCPMVNALNYPVGFISLHYLGMVSPSQMDGAQTEKLASKLVGYLNEGAITDAK